MSFCFPVVFGKGLRNVFLKMRQIWRPGSARTLLACSLQRSPNPYSGINGTRDRRNEKGACQRGGKIF